MIPKEFISLWLEQEAIKLDQVNNGMCEEFATDALKFFPNGEIVYTENFVDYDNDQGYGGHAWIECDGKHYDCMSPEGVDAWNKLVFFS